MIHVPLTALGSLVDPVESWSPERDAPDDSFVYIDLSGVDQEAKAITGAREMPCSEAPSRARQLVAVGDVLVSTVRPNLNAVAQVPSEFDGATASTGFCVLRPRPKALDGAYLLHWVRSPRFVSEMVRRATGASYPAVSDRIILESALPLPTLAEQRRIAEVLDRAEALRAKRRSTLALLDTLTQSVFLDTFGDPTTNPKGWRLEAFGTVGKARLGKMLDQKKQTGEYRRHYLRNANVQWFRFALNDVHEMDFNDREREIFRLVPGDLLICEGGEPGRAAVWHGEVDECYYQKALHRIRPHPDLAVAEYLAWLLWFMADRGRLGDHVTSATIAHLTGEKLAAMLIPLPPVDLQLLFRSRLDAIETVRVRYQSSDAAISALIESLQHRAFRDGL